MAEFLPPLPVDQMVIDSLNAFLSAASLHLGEALPNGQRVVPNPTEAWLALMGASALLTGLSDVMAEPVRTPVEQTLDTLLRRFAERYPEEVVPVPGLLQGRI
jgi:hypothetical protein